MRVRKILILLLGITLIKPIQIYADDIFKEVDQNLIDDNYFKMIPIDSTEYLKHYFTEEEVIISSNRIEVNSEPQQSNLQIEILEPQSYDIPSYPGVKKWMSYKAFSAGTKQELLQMLAYTDNNGCRLVDNRYCIAVGSHFDTEIGQYMDLVLENGAIIPCVMADQKADVHTDSSNIFSNTTNNLCASEFVVDPSTLNNQCKDRGDMSFLYSEWNSPVKSVLVYNINALYEE